MSSLLQCLHEATPDLVEFVRPHLVAARLKNSSMRVRGEDAERIRESLRAEVDNDLRAAGDLSGVLKLILFDSWDQLESCEPAVFNKKLKQDLHHVLDLRNRLSHPEHHVQPSEEQNLLDHLTYSIFLSDIGADSTRREAASSEVKERIGVYVGTSKAFEEAHSALTAEQVSLREELEARSAEWVEQQSRLLSEQQETIQLQLDQLRAASEVDESKRAAAEEAYKVAEKQREDYANLLEHYREALHGAVDTASTRRDQSRWWIAAVVLLVTVLGATVWLGLRLGSTHPDSTAVVSTNTATASASIPGLAARQGDFVWVKGVKTVECEQYVSKAGLTHLTYVVEDGDGNRLQGIFYEGGWGASTESLMNSGKTLDLYGRVGEYKGEVSLEASQVQESEL